MWYRIAADAVVAVHLLFIGFVVFTCPLTPVENYLRHRAGEAGYRGGFIAHYLVSVVYPPGLTRGVQIGLGAAVLVIAVAGYAGYLHRHAPGLLARRAARRPAA